MVTQKVNFHQFFLIMIKLITTLKEKDISIPPYKDEFKIKSPNFLYGEKIPKKYTPYGKDIHPSFYWYNFPKETKSFAIVCEDPDTPSGKIFTHWIVKNIPGTVTKIEEGEIIGEEIINSWGFSRYSGPKPPNGEHRYFFRIYAFRDEQLSAKSMNGVKKEIEIKNIGEAVIMGTFG